jgi:hypothetical protein
MPSSSFFSFSGQWFHKSIIKDFSVQKLDQYLYNRARKYSLSRAKVLDSCALAFTSSCSRVLLFGGVQISSWLLRSFSNMTCWSTFIPWTLDTKTQRWHTPELEQTHDRRFAFVINQNETGRLSSFGELDRLTSSFSVVKLVWFKSREASICNDSLHPKNSLEHSLEGV